MELELGGCGELLLFSRVLGLFPSVFRSARVLCSALGMRDDLKSIGVKKMEIPTLSEEEKWRMMRETFVMNIRTSLGFIMEKLGQEGMKEYSKLTAESYA